MWTRADFWRYYSITVAPGRRYGAGGRGANAVPDMAPFRLHYHWYPILSAYELDRAPRLAALLNLPAGASVIIVGAGFGPTCTGLASLGYDAIGTDISSYILTEKGNTEEAEIRELLVAAGIDPDADLVLHRDGVTAIDPLDTYLRGGRTSPQPRATRPILGEDGSSRPSRNSIRGALASDPAAIITEEVINSLSDADALAVCDGAAKLAAENGRGAVYHMLSPLQPGVQQDAGLSWRTYPEWRAFLDANGFAGQQIVPTVSARGQAASEQDPGWFVPAYSRLI